MCACCQLAHGLLLVWCCPHHLQGLRTFEQVDEVEAMQEGRRKKGQWEQRLRAYAVLPPWWERSPTIASIPARLPYPPLPLLPCCPPCGGAEQQQQQQAAAVRNRLHRVAVDEGALQEALVQSIDAVHAAAALGVQHSMLPDGRGNGLAAWRQ